ncbi:MAG: hypothetical protein ACPKPY_08325 [Nitrososphaeraceae archaeon]
MQEMEEQLCNLDLNIPTTTTCQGADPLPTSLGIPGSEITVLTGGEEVCQTSAVTTCGDDTNLAGAVVTDIALCDVITEETNNIKTGEAICEFCINLSTQSLQSGQAVLELGNATNSYENDGNGKLGVWVYVLKKIPYLPLKV